MLHEVCRKQNFLPEVKTEGEFQRLHWESVKWSDSFPEVKGVTHVLDELDRMDAEDGTYAYKQFILGEDYEDTEVRSNTAGNNKLYSYYVYREVVCSEGAIGEDFSFPSKEKVEALRVEYPAGTRVELVSMEDENSTLKPGDKGTVRYVDDIGTIHVGWDCGSGLGIVYGEDEVRILEAAEEGDEKQE